MPTAMPLDYNKESIPVLKLGDCLTGAISGSTLHLGPFPAGTNVLSIFATGNCHVVIDTSPTTTALSTHGFIPANVMIDVSANYGSESTDVIYAHIIQDGSSTGTIWVTNRT